MHLRSGHGYADRADRADHADHADHANRVDRVDKAPVGSPAVSNSKRKKTKSEPSMLRKLLTLLGDLLYYIFLSALLGTVFAVVASPFINTGQPGGDYYDILGLSPLADRKDIRAAYRKLSIEHHPDKVDSDDAGDAAYLRIRKAYETLNVEDHERCMYDLQNDIEGRWSVDDCINARKEYIIREQVRRREELEKTRQKIEDEKKERQRRREEREEEKERAKLASRAKAAFKGYVW